MVKIPITFNERYFNDDRGIGYRPYRNYPHILDRAIWIRDNLSGSILEIGSAYGFLIFELDKLGIEIDGIDISSYAVSQADKSIASRLKIGDVKDAPYSSNQYDWIVSWNVLDCLNDERHAQDVASVLNDAGENQLHVLTMGKYAQKYTDLGYFQRDYTYWRSLFPDATLICSDCRTVYGGSFTEIPLHGKVAI